MTIRIDTLRRQLAATRTLLELAETHLTDLHALAYERHQPTTAERVHGGNRDWALDTHGDPIARNAYRSLATAIDTGVTQIATGAHKAAAILRSPGTKGDTRGPRITIAEHADALAAKARRIQRGEEPGPILPQPALAEAIAALERRARDAEQRAAKLQRRVDRLRARLTQITGSASTT